MPLGSAVLSAIRKETHPDEHFFRSMCPQIANSSASVPVLDLLVLTESGQ